MGTNRRPMRCANLGRGHKIFTSDPSCWWFFLSFIVPISYPVHVTSYICLHLQEFSLQDGEDLMSIVHGVN